MIRKWEFSRKIARAGVSICKQAGVGIDEANPVGFYLLADAIHAVRVASINMLRNYRDWKRKFFLDFVDSGNGVVGGVVIENDNGRLSVGEMLRY